MTLGIDTQADGFYWLLACWGRKMELWLPLTDRITGDLRSEAPWKALSEVLETAWLDKEGNVYKPVASGIDVQGDMYPQALEFVRAKGGRCGCARCAATRWLGHRQLVVPSAILRNCVSR